MPLRPADLLSCKDGVVELAAELIAPDRDDPTTLLGEIRERLLEQQSTIMTDAAILDPPSLAIESTVVCRTPIPTAVQDGLAQLGFHEGAETSGGRPERSIFSRLTATKRSRTSLDRWRSPFLRASDLSGRFARFEAILFDGSPDGPDIDVAGIRAEAVVEAASALGAAVRIDLAGLRTLEDALLQARASKPGRLVLLPAAVTAIAAFCGECLRSEAPSTRWSLDNEEDTPLHVQRDGGLIVRTDPVQRIVSFVMRGRQAALTDYAASVLGQSLTEAAKA